MKISLVVTTYNRPDALARVLSSLTAQQRPIDEVLVADDGSGEATAQVVHAAAASLPLRHVWLDGKRRRPCVVGQDGGVDPAQAH